MQTDRQEGRAEQAIREKVASEILRKLSPLTSQDKYSGGYDCCGCSTYDMIVRDAAEVALGREPRGYDFDGIEDDNDG